MQQHKHMRRDVRESDLSLVLKVVRKNYLNLMHLGPESVSRCQFRETEVDPSSWATHTDVVMSGRFNLIPSLANNSVKDLI